MSDTERVGVGGLIELGERNTPEVDRTISVKGLRTTKNQQTNVNSYPRAFGKTFGTQVLT